MTQGRQIILEGGCNFRDLGGYRADDGRHVRSGRLYRSGVLAYMTQSDLETVSSLGIRAIFDLRRPEERDREPTLWPETTSVRILSQSEVGDKAAVEKLIGGRTLGETREAMLAFYRNMPTMLETRLRNLFECLASDEMPLLFHCSAGKDRTGVAAALILSLLGVPRETILADYTLTSQAVDLGAFMFSKRKAMLGLGNGRQALAELPRELLGALLAADEAYLDAALTALESRHGSIEAYLDNVLGVSLQGQQRIRNNLLE